MRNEARKEFTLERQMISKTGGGKESNPPKPTSARIMELFGDEPGFSGIQGGVESGKCLCVLSCTTVTSFLF